MRALLLAALCCSCVATSGDLDQAVAEIGDRIAVVADSARESAAAARVAYEQGEITYKELQDRLRDIRAATLDASEQVTKDVVADVKEAIAKRPEVIAETGASIVSGTVPGPLGELLGGLILAGGTYMAASRRAKAEADRVNQARDMARVMRHEPVSTTPKPPTT